MPARAYDYAPISDAAARYLRAKGQTVAALVGVSPQAVYQWARRDKSPSYTSVCAVLAKTGAGDTLSLEDFGYTELPTGQVARLLAPGHAPAPDVFYRASGVVGCATCGRAYARHPYDPKRVARGLPLNILCDGRRVKL